MKPSLPDTHRSFSHLNEAWYGDACRAAMVPSVVRPVDEVTFGLSCDEGGTRGEMMMRWYELDGKDCPRLECYHDAWAVLGTFSDVIAALAALDTGDQEASRITPAQFKALLVGLGFKDQTERVSPYGMSQMECADRAELKRLIALYPDVR